MTRRTGRRPGDADTRGDILVVARRRFARDGYDATSLRGIAREAEVDPALVHHYFAGKAQLFEAALALPFDAPSVVAHVLDGPVDGVGERLARTFLQVWDGPGSEHLEALLRSAAANEHAARMLREFMTDAVLREIAGSLDADEPELRAGLCAAQLVGVALLRRVLHFDALVTPDAEELIRWLAPTLQRYLTATGPTDGSP